MKNKVKLNLGCGNEYLEGYTNIDVNKKVKADIYCDFTNDGIPFKSNSVDEILCKSIFEHIPNPLKFLEEIKRVLKKKGKATIITSNASYIIYHFPRKRAYHESYNLNHPVEDQHYFMFQKGHLRAFTKKLGMKLVRLEYYIGNTNPSKDRSFQKFLGFILGHKFGYADYLWILEK